MLDPNKIVYFKDDAEVEEYQTPRETYSPDRIAAYSVRVMEEPPARFDRDYTWVHINEESDNGAVAKWEDIVIVRSIDEVEI
jgi:hypothetical protein